MQAPAQKAGVPAPPLVHLKSPYRFVVQPISDNVIDLEREKPDRQVAVLIPELAERRWYNYLLYNQRGRLLKALLLLKGNQRIAIIDVPWYLGDYTSLAPQRHYWFGFRRPARGRVAGDEGDSQEES